MKKLEVINAMRKQRGWIVRERAKCLILSKQFGVKKPKMIEFSLTEKSENYTIEHPNYIFVNVIAHFRAVQQERRLSLNKCILTSVINSLKNAGVWNFVENQKFLEVNDECVKSDKGKVSQLLRKLLK